MVFVTLGLLKNYQTDSMAATNFNEDGYMSDTEDELFIKTPEMIKDMVYEDTIIKTDEDDDDEIIETTETKTKTIRRQKNKKSARRSRKRKTAYIEALEKELAHASCLVEALMIQRNSDVYQKRVYNDLVIGLIDVAKRRRVDV